MSTETKNGADGKKEYHSPHVYDYGNVADITAAGGMGGDADGAPAAEMNRTML
jgi:hypothetical protein